LTATLEQVAITSGAVSATQSRLEKTALVSRCLGQLSASEVQVGVAWLSGELRQGRIGLGHALLAGVSALPAAASTLTLLEVDQAFERLAQTKGSGSAAQRERELGSLLSRATAVEQDFLQRLLLGELRQGALEGVMIEAIARAYGVAAGSVRRALMLSADLGGVALAALERGEAGLGGFALQLFRPVQPMLAQTAADLSDALSRVTRPALELKLDGARIQVHRLDDEVRVFSRQQNEVTTAVPEVVEAVLRMPARSLVLDGEAIALAADQRPLPFQATMRRFGRRLDVDSLRRRLPLSCFFFDLLHRDGTDLMGHAASERVRALGELVPATGDATALPAGEPRAEARAVPRIIVDDLAQGEAFLQGALQAGHEGVVAKALDAPYEAGRRGGSWLKIKRAHTLDLVVLAAEWGSGRRKGWLSNLHLGARNPDGGFTMLGKTFKGMTDQILGWQTEQLLAREIGREGATVYVRPELVVEVAFDGLQTSPHYPGGLALRFARIKGYRMDKRADHADTIETVQMLARLAHP
jgi:DNA ligase-1